MDAALLTRILSQMLRIRKFEERLASLFQEGGMHGTAHFYVGQEAIAAGVCGALQPGDRVASTHRGHGHCIAMGMDMDRMMAEIMGKADGYCKGKGGSMHIADMEHGILGANGIVGGGLSIATGAALAMKMRGENHIAVCFFGDGASNEGSFHESLNLASVWQLPVLFVCEDNCYGMSMHKSRAMHIQDIAVRAKSYGISGESVDGNDVWEVYRAAQKARAYVLEQGPMLLVCRSYRLLGHSKSDQNVYRTQTEIQQWREKDPIQRLNGFLLRQGLCTQTQLDEIHAQACRDIQAAVEFALQSPYPEPDTLTEDVYA